MSTPLELLTNGLQVTSTANYTNSVTSITVNTPITGPSIPALSAGQTMRCYWDGELIGVTAISGTGNVNWTISRAIEGTIPVSHVTGSTIYQILSQGGLQQSIKDTVQGASCGPYASLPSSANTGAQYICTDSPYDLVWTGSAWSPFAYNAAATIPLDSNFTWINQDSATTSSSYGPIVFTRAGGGTDCVRARVRTIPYSTPRRLTCCFVPATIQANTNSVGIFIADSGTTPKMHFFC